MHSSRRTICMKSQGLSVLASCHTFISLPLHPRAHRTESGRIDDALVLWAFQVFGKLDSDTLFKSGVGTKSKRMMIHVCMNVVWIKGV